jgi:acetate kinase
LFTVGVTCALAFELPSEPIYHITQKLRNNLYGVKNEEEETTTAAAESSANASSRFDYDNKRLNYVNYNKQSLYDSMNKHSYYYSTNNKYYYKPLSPNYGFNDKSDNYYNNYIPDSTNNLLNQQYQSSNFVTPLNQTKSVWTSAIKR